MSYTDSQLDGWCEVDDWCAVYEQATRGRCEPQVSAPLSVPSSPRLLSCGIPPGSSPMLLPRLPSGIFTSSGSPQFTIAETSVTSLPECPFSLLAPDTLLSTTTETGPDTHPHSLSMISVGDTGAEGAVSEAYQSVPTARWFQLLNADQAFNTSSASHPQTSLRLWGCEDVKRGRSSNRSPGRRFSELRRSLTITDDEQQIAAIKSLCTCEWKKSLFPDESWVLQTGDKCCTSGITHQNTSDQLCIGGTLPKSVVSLDSAIKNLVDQQAISNCLVSSLQQRSDGCHTNAADQHSEMIRLLESTTGLKAPKEAINWNWEQIDAYFDSRGELWHFESEYAGPFESGSPVLSGSPDSFALVVGSFFSQFDEPREQSTRQVRRSLIVQDSAKLVEAVSSACSCQWKELRHAHQGYVLQTCSPCLSSCMRQLQDRAVAGQLEDWEAECNNNHRDKVLLFEDVSEFFEDAEFGFFGNIFETRAPRDPFD